MAGIILGHFYGNAVQNTGHIDELTQIVAYIMSFGGKLGVQIFIIISGYFLCKQYFSVNKLGKLILQSWFWNVVILIVILFFTDSMISSHNMIEAFFPLTPLNWFVRSYLLLYISFPLFNRWIINRLSRAHFELILLCLFILFFLIPSIIMTGVGGYFITYFVFMSLYLLGAYIRLYCDYRIMKKIVLVGGSTLVIFILYIVFYSLFSNSHYGNLSLIDPLILTSSVSGIVLLPISVSVFIFF